MADVQKKMDIAMRLQESKLTKHAITFENYNRIIVTECDIDKYDVALKVTDHMEDFEGN